MDNEKQLVDSIKKKCANNNINNITRTKAYLEYYKRNPEVEWAFLAHLVSRNGGWNMTDLKGDIVGEVISPNKKSLLFSLLERSNALIFHDAYTQLLLYETCKKRNKSMFHLLKAFHVSSFMIPIWEEFFKYKNVKMISIAKIINEQNYIQKRVMQQQSFKEILNSVEFKIQDLFGFSYVLFPYKKKNSIRLSGKSIQEFDDLNNRIKIGKYLYSLLFEHNLINKGAIHFAHTVPHSGSRADYWPEVFSPKQQANSFIYSPKLIDVWPNVTHSFLDKTDWFETLSVMEELKTLPVIKKPDITKEYSKDLFSLYTVTNTLNHLI